MENIVLCAYITNVSILKNYIYTCPKLKNITLTFSNGKQIHKCLLCNVVWDLYRKRVKDFIYGTYYRCDKCNLSDSVILPIPSIVHKLFV